MSLNWCPYHEQQFSIIILWPKLTGCVYHENLKYAPGFEGVGMYHTITSPKTSTNFTKLQWCNISLEMLRLKTFHFNLECLQQVAIMIKNIFN